jgi:hypothetical protein
MHLVVFWKWARGADVLYSVFRAQTAYMKAAHRLVEFHAVHWKTLRVYGDAQSGKYGFLLGSGKK